MVKIPNYQVFCLLFVCFLSSAAIFFPPQVEGENGWLSGLFATGYNLILIGIIYVFYKKGKGKSILELLNNHPFIKAVVVSIILFYLVVLNTLEVTNLRLIVAQNLLQVTPVSVILIAGIGVALFAAQQGIEGIGRMSPWFLVLILLAILFNVVTLAPEVQLENLLPLVPAGVSRSIIASLSVWDIIGFLFVSLLIAPYINQPKQTYKALLAVVLVTAVALMIQGIYVAGIFKYELFPKLSFPVLQIVRYTDLAGVIENAEVIFLSQWLLVILIKIAFLFWLVIDVVEKALKLKERNFLLLPFGLLIASLSLAMFPNTAEFNEFKKNFYVLFAISVQFFLPLVLLPFVVTRQE